MARRLLDFEPEVPAKRSRPSPPIDAGYDLLFEPADPWDLKYMRHAVYPRIGEFENEGKKRIGTIGWKDIPVDIKRVIRDLVLHGDSYVFDHTNKSGAPVHRRLCVQGKLFTAAICVLSTDYYWSVYNCGGPSDNSECKTKVEFRTIRQLLAEETSLVWILKLKLKALDMLSLRNFEDSNRPRYRDLIGIVLPDEGPQTLYGERVLCGECYRHEQFLYRQDQADLLDKQQGM